jgi:pimeloyl-ACP methyl ester carboxylesterase
MPLLTVSGSADTAYTQVAREMAEASPHGIHVSIDGAGHNVILDAPHALVSTLTDIAFE